MFRFDQEECWATDPNAFIADEDDEMASFNPRLAAIDFVIVSPDLRAAWLGDQKLMSHLNQALVDTFESKALAALWSAFQRLAAEADAARAASEEDWCVLPATSGGKRTGLLIFLQVETVRECSSYRRSCFE